MRPGGDEWPVRLWCSLMDRGHVMRYAMGESVSVVASPRHELLGRAALVLVQDSQKRVASPDVILELGAPPPGLFRGSSPEVVLAPLATSPSLALGFTIQLLWDGPMLADPAASAPECLLRALGAFYLQDP